MEKKNKKKTQPNPETSILSVAEIEGILNKETLKNLPCLVDEMDENLAININNLLINSIFKELKLDKQNVIEIVKQSKKLHYDNKSQFIKFKEKADRNIIIFRNILESDEDVIPKCDYFKNAIGNKSKCLIGKLKGIDKVDRNLFFIFDNEDHTQEIEKLINTSLKNKENDFENLDFTLAAETLKRRISPFMNYSLTLEDQKDTINSILINPTPYIPRRFTVGNKAKSPSKKLSIIENTNNLQKHKARVSMNDTCQENFIDGKKKKKNNFNSINNRNLQPNNTNYRIRNDQNLNNNRINRQNQNNFNSTGNKINNSCLNNDFSNGFNLSSIGNINNPNNQSTFPLNQNYNINNSNFYPNNNNSINNKTNLNNSISFTNSIAYMKGYFSAVNSLNVFNKNLYNSLLIQQQQNVLNSNSHKSISPNKKRTSINKLDAANNNYNSSILNLINDNKTSILNNKMNINSYNNINTINTHSASVNYDINDLNRKNILDNISRRSPSLKKLDVTNADYYANLLLAKNLNNTSMINNANNSTLANISLVENCNDNNATSIFEISTNDRSSFKKASNLNLSVVKEKNEDENIKLACDNNRDNINIPDFENNNNNNNFNLQKEVERNKQDFLGSTRNSFAVNFDNFNPDNFYNFNNYNNGTINNKDNNYFNGVNFTPINPKSNQGYDSSMTSFNLNFSTSNKKASIFSNDGYYFRNSIIQNTTANNPIYNNNNEITTDNNLANTSYFGNDINPENINNDNFNDVRVKSKTIYNKNKNNKILQNMQKAISNNITNNTNNNKINNNNTNNNNNNPDFPGTPLKQTLNFGYRQSKLSNFNENLLSPSKKMSTLSFGDEMNLINEINKNLKFMPEQTRKSSLNFLSMLKSQDFSKYRNSAFSVENDLGILKEYENNVEKSADIAYQYETNDIISVYFHMNYLKLFEFPEEFKDVNFLEGIMTKEVKGNIEKLNEKKLIIKHKLKENSVLLKSFNKKISHNSTSKIRLSQNVNSYQMMNLMEESITEELKNKRKRHFSLKN